MESQWWVLFWYELQWVWHGYGVSQSLSIKPVVLCAGIKRWLKSLLAASFSPLQLSWATWGGRWCYADSSLDRCQFTSLGTLSYKSISKLWLLLFYRLTWLPKGPLRFQGCLSWVALWEAPYHHPFDMDHLLSYVGLLGLGHFLHHLVC